MPPSVLLVVVKACPPLSEPFVNPVLAFALTPANLCATFEALWLSENPIQTVPEPVETVKLILNLIVHFVLFRLDPMRFVFDKSNVPDVFVLEA